MMLARNDGLFSLWGIDDCARPLGDLILAGVTGFLFGVAAFGVVGRTTLGMLWGVFRVIGYLS